MKRQISYMVIAGFAVIMMTSGCKKEPSKEKAQTEGLDGNFEELNQVLSQIPTVDVDMNDLKFDDGEGMVGFLRANDPGFFERNAAFLGGDKTSNKALLQSSSGGNSWGQLTEKRRITANLSTAALFYLKNKEGVAENAAVRQVLGDSREPKQEGLGYSFGQRIWNVREQQPQNRSCKQAFYGLDCSGLLYNVLGNSDLNVLRYSPNANSEIWADNYWNKLDRWNAVLKNNYNRKLAFKSYKRADLEKLPRKGLLKGDVIFYFNSSGRAEHVGIVIEKDGQLLVAQSNGSSQYCAENLIKGRGPRAIDALLPFKQKWGYNDYGVIRLTANIDSKWRLFFKCEGQSSDAFYFDVEIKTDANGVITPVQAEGTDYDGATKLYVNFTGRYDEQNNVLSGKTDISFSSGGTNRVDTFSVRLESDSQDNINMIKTKDNGGCPSVMRIVNLESSALQLPKVGTLMKENKAQLYYSK